MCQVLYFVCPINSLSPLIAVFKKKNKPSKQTSNPNVLGLLHNTGFGLVKGQLGGMSGSLCNSPDTVQRLTFNDGSPRPRDFLARRWCCCLCCVCEAYRLSPGSCWVLVSLGLPSPGCHCAALSFILHTAADVILMLCMCREDGTAEACFLYYLSYFKRKHC